MIGIVLLLALAAQAALPQTGIEDVGLKVGEDAPDFELRDQHGTPRRLSSLLGPNGAMLVFYRSADW
jgi:hypothetical protein